MTPVPNPMPSTSLATTARTVSASTPKICDDHTVEKPASLAARALAMTVSIGWSVSMLVPSRMGLLMVECDR